MVPFDFAQGAHKIYSLTPFTHYFMAKLGQHFLKSRKIAMDIVNAGDVVAGDVVLEIGPGKGILTKALLHKAKKVIAVEKSKELVDYLKNKFVKEIHEEKLIIINEDILDFNPKNYGLKTIDYKIIANIPYYITGEILRKFLSAEHQPKHMVLLVQKEVAQRIVGKGRRTDAKQDVKQTQKNSVLSISVKAYGTPRYVESVPARFFSPPPKVDSAILAIKDISKNFFEEVSEEVFFNIVKTGFAHKRKLLASNLAQVLINTDKKHRSTLIKNIFKECDIPEKSRAEDLRINDWKCLVKEVTVENSTTQAAWMFRT